MKTFLSILQNENGHGQVPSTKELLLGALMVLTFPVSIPLMKLRNKIKERKEKKK